MLISYTSVPKIHSLIYTECWHNWLTPQDRCWETPMHQLWEHMPEGQGLPNKMPLWSPSIISNSPSRNFSLTRNNSLGFSWREECCFKRKTQKKVPGGKAIFHHLLQKYYKFLLGMSTKVCKHTAENDKSLKTLCVNEGPRPLHQETAGIVLYICVQEHVSNIAHKKILTSMYFSKKTTFTSLQTANNVSNQDKPPKPWCSTKPHTKTTGLMEKTALDRRLKPHSTLSSEHQQKQ